MENVQKIFQLSNNSTFLKDSNISTGIHTVFVDKARCLLNHKRVVCFSFTEKNLLGVFQRLLTRATPDFALTQATNAFSTNRSGKV